ncbi:MAG TPA: hypothetical protein VD735_02225 [Candidatus Saccharimonadales bacterium]|nr:hypothetical protein [Candidatus Saccharimonadales bacterium]
MLVKFLSYIATLIGTKRYKPLVFSGLALGMTLIGVTAVWSVYQKPHGTAASTVQQAEDPTKEALSGQTPSARSTREDAPSATQQPSQDSTATPTPTPATTPNSITAVSPSIQSSTESTVTLKKGTTSQPLSFNMSDSSAVQWTVTSDSATSPTIVGNQEATAATGFSFSLRVGQAAPGTYTFTVHAKDSVRNLDLTKTITVTVPAE